MLHQGVLLSVAFGCVRCVGYSVAYGVASDPIVLVKHNTRVKHLRTTSVVAPSL